MISGNNFSNVIFKYDFELKRPRMDKIGVVPLAKKDVTDPAPTLYFDKKRFIFLQVMPIKE